MDSTKEQELDARLSRIESTLVALQRTVESLIGERRKGASTERPETNFAARADVSGSRSSQSRQGVRDDIGSVVSEWFSSRAPEWWLSRLGIGFVVIAVLFLYGYAIDRGWITPPVRVLTGALVGSVLFWAATRTSDDEKSSLYGLGLRQVLYGGALASWYVTAYAAAVWYGLISTAAARLLFFVLALISTL